MEGFARFPMETYPRLASELGFSEQDGPRREHIEVLCRLASPDAMRRACTCPRARMRAPRALRAVRALRAERAEKIPFLAPKQSENGLA